MLLKPGSEAGEEIPKSTATRPRAICIVASLREEWDDVEVVPTRVGSIFFPDLITFSSRILRL
jgi:hypothetical protein